MIMNLDLVQTVHCLSVVRCAPNMVLIASDELYYLIVITEMRIVRCSVRCGSVLLLNNKLYL